MIIPGIRGGNIAQLSLQQRQLAQMAKAERDRRKQEGLQLALQAANTGIGAIGTGFDVLGGFLDRSQRENLLNMALGARTKEGEAQREFERGESALDRQARQEAQRRREAFDVGMWKREEQSRLGREELAGLRTANQAKLQAEIARQTGRAGERAETVKHGQALDLLGMGQKGTMEQQKAKALADQELSRQEFEQKKELLPFTGPQAELQPAATATQGQAFSKSPFFSMLPPEVQNEILVNPTGPEAARLQDLERLQMALGEGVPIAPGTKGTWQDISEAWNMAQQMHEGTPERLDAIESFLRQHPRAGVELPGEKDILHLREHLAETEDPFFSFPGRAQRQKLQDMIKYWEWLYSR